MKIILIVSLVYYIGMSFILHKRKNRQNKLESEWISWEDKSYE